MDSGLTLTQAQSLVDEWIRTYGVRYFSPLTLRRTHRRPLGAPVYRQPNGGEPRGSLPSKPREEDQP